MKHFFTTGYFLILISVLSCSKDPCNPVYTPSEVYNALNTSGRKVQNPYSLSIMQAALDSLIATKAIEEVCTEITLEATDYYIRMSSLDTNVVKSLQNMDVELFDYPLDYEFDSDSEYYFDPEMPTEDLVWQYTAVPTSSICTEVEYEDFVEASECGETVYVDMAVAEQETVSCELLDLCYVPEHDLEAKSSLRKFISADELEEMAFKIAGIETESSMPRTKASSCRPSGHVYVNSPNGVLPVKGVKVRAQRFIRWSTTYTNDYGYFYISSKYASPNISIIYSNTKGFTLWGNWLFLAPATYTINRCSSASSFNKVFYNSTFSPWSWAVVNNAAYDYYTACYSNGVLSGVALPPCGMKLWCMNLSWEGIGGGAPMIKHLVASRILSGVSAITSLLCSFGLIPILGTSVVAILVNIFAPDILLVTYNKSYKDLYSTTFHELSHASHFVSLGEWKYGQMIWYEMTHGDKQNFYGIGDTGSNGERLCELSEAYAYSIENMIRRSLPGNYVYAGTSSSYFFYKYTSVLTSLISNGILTPGEIFSCMNSSTIGMEALLNNLCVKYPSRSAAIRSEMQNYGL